MQFSNLLAARHPKLLMGTMRVDNLGSPFDRPSWSRLREQETEGLRRRFSTYNRKETLLSSPWRQYADYYKAFKKTYPVLLQLESVVVKSRPIRSSCPAIETLFLAEVVSGLLAAGHDHDLITPPFTLEVAQGDEKLDGLAGNEKRLKPGDVFLTAGKTVLSSVLEGQDSGSRLTEATQSALYVVYALDGIGEKAVADFFSLLGSYIRTAFPEAKINDGIIFGPGKVAG